MEDGVGSRELVAPNSLVSSLLALLLHDDDRGVREPGGELGYFQLARLAGLS